MNDKIKTFVEGVPVDPGVYSQIKNLSSLSFVEHLVLLPDCHVGKGSTVGTVIATVGAIIPASVGVDIGCGVNAVKTSLNASDLPDNLSNLRNLIELSIPFGGPGVKGSWSEEGRYGAPASVASSWNNNFETDYNKIISKYPEIKAGITINQLCSLGSGNHTVELTIDENNYVWVLVHSGSRGIGNKIGQFFIEKAKEEMRKWHVNLPDSDMAYLKEGSEYFDDYTDAVWFAQRFALENRRLMVERVIKVLRENIKPFKLLNEEIKCHHNYISKEIHFGKEMFITRKGAVRAEVGDRGIILGSMATKSYVVNGLGNSDSLKTCSHGAGRVMSRSAAKKIISLEEHIADTNGVECRKDVGVIDESPKAYKNIETVIQAQTKLITVEGKLNPILVIKG